MQYFSPIIIGLLKSESLFPCKALFVLLCLLGSHSFGWSQNRISTAKILSQEIKSEAHQTLERSLDWLQNSKQEMPRIDQMDFRTETSEWDTERQEYLFRMRFNNRASRLAHRNLIKNDIYALELKGAQLKEFLLMDRYEQIVEWYYLELELEDLATERDLLTDKKTIYQKMLSNSLNFDFNNLLKTEENLQDLTQEEWQLERRKANLIQQLVPNAPADYQLKDSSWISMNNMQEVLQKIMEVPSQNLEFKRQEEEIQYAQLEYELERAEGKRFFDFAQLKYAGRDKQSIGQEFSIGLAFNIPTQSNTLLKRNEIQLDIFEKQYEKELIQEELETQIKLAYTKFQNLVEEHQRLAKNNEANQLEKMYEQYRQVGDLSPLLLLQLKESILKSNIKLKRIEEKTCEAFLEILQLKGIFYLNPRINYLSNDLAPF